MRCLLLLAALLLPTVAAADTFGDRWQAMYQRTVKTVPIAAAVPLPAAAPPAPAKVSDVCTRHGMYKVRVGRRWHCRHASMD